MARRAIIRFAIILLIPFLMGGAPSRSKTYTTGTVIDPDDVTEDEDNIFTYLQAGVDTLASNIAISTSAACTFSGTTTLSGTTNMSGVFKIGGVTVTASGTELNYVDGVTSAIQTQFTNILNGTTGFSGLTASGDLDIGAHEFRAETFESDVATGTAPFTVASTTAVDNLAADYWDAMDTSASITSLGTIASGVWQGTAVATGYGGTGKTTKLIAVITYNGSDSNQSVAHTLGVAPTWMMLIRKDDGVTSEPYFWMTGFPANHLFKYNGEQQGDGFTAAPDGTYFYFTGNKTGYNDGGESYSLVCGIGQ